MHPLVRLFLLLMNKYGPANTRQAQAQPSLCAHNSSILSYQVDFLDFLGGDGVDGGC